MSSDDLSSGSYGSFTGSLLSVSRSNSAPSFTFSEISTVSKEVVDVAERLAESMRVSEARTMAQLLEQLKNLTDSIQEEHPSLTMQALCQLFTAAIVSQENEYRSWEDQRAALVRSSERFIQKIRASQVKIARTAKDFLQDNVNVLVHGCSRVVKTVLLYALSSRRRFNLFVTQGFPSTQTDLYVKSLAQHGVFPTVISDSSVAYWMSRMDLVLCGAAAIAENGGVVNQIGTYQIALIAASLRKPFYVVAESFKFCRALFPLKQTDIAPLFKKPARCSQGQQSQQGGADSLMTAHEAALTRDNSFFDFTPPKLITLLITDLGVITPSAVSDELIKLERRLVE